MMGGGRVSNQCSAAEEGTSRVIAVRGVLESSDIWDQQLGKHKKTTRVLRRHMFVFSKDRKKVVR